MRAALARALAPLRGRPLGRHAVHGDFWAGNLSERDGELRVFDWEWAAERGHPLVDLVMFHVAGEAAVDPAEVAAQVAQELSARDADPAFATALLVPVLGELALRWRWQWDVPSGAERRLLRLMRRAARLLPEPPTGGPGPGPGSAGPR
jgi:aminoglycoside phosphotransferase (APT) family kinase protein